MKSLTTTKEKIAYSVLFAFTLALFLSDDNLDFSEGGELTFTLSFQIVPDIKLPNYEKKFKINMTKYLQTDQDLEMSLNELRQQHSNIKTVDEGAKSNNFIMGDFQELDEGGLPIIGKKMEKQYIKFL